MLSVGGSNYGAPGPEYNLSKVWRPWMCVYIYLRIYMFICSELIEETG